MGRLLSKAMAWLSALAGLIVGFEVYSRINPRFHSPFFSDAWGMVFVVAVYSLLYLTIAPRFQKWLDKRCTDCRRDTAE